MCLIVNINMRSLSQKGRGPLSIWRQCHVGECDMSTTGAEPSLACEVELVVRDFFESDEIEVDDLTIVVLCTRTACWRPGWSIYDWSSP